MNNGAEANRQSRITSIYAQDDSGQRVQIVNVAAKPHIHFKSSQVCAARLTKLARLPELD
jgi:hypothetical protein